MTEGGLVTLDRFYCILDSKSIKEYMYISVYFTRLTADPTRARLKRMSVHFVEKVRLFSTYLAYNFYEKLLD